MSAFSVWSRALPVAVTAVFFASSAQAVPVLSTPATVGFGNVLVGGSKSLDVTATNTGDMGSGNCGSSRLCITFGPAVDSAGDEFTPNTTSVLSSFLQANASVSRSYTYTPTARQTDSATVAVTPSVSSFGTKTVNLTGKGVAAQNQVGSSDAGAVRVGTTGSASVTVQNVGDGNLSGLAATSNLQGTMSGPVGSTAFTGPSPDAAINLADGATKSFQYGFTPGARGAFSADVTAGFSNGKSDGTNGAQNVVKTISGTGVGPVFDSSVAPGSSIDFGLLSPGATATADLTISNITLDLGFDVELNGLSLLDIVFSGDDAGLFSIVGGFTPTVLDPDGVSSLTLTLQYTAPAAYDGAYSAILTLLTDEGAAFGGDGADYSFSLVGGTIPATVSEAQVPEPVTAALLVAGLLGLGVGRRRRRAG